MSARKLRPCGTLGAYRLHQRRGEDPCVPCQEAYRAWRATRQLPNPPVLQPCGTPGAYRRHLRHGEKPCDACRAAYNARRPSRSRKAEAEEKGHLVLTADSYWLCTCPRSALAHYADTVASGYAEMTVPAGKVSA